MSFFEGEKVDDRVCPKCGKDLVFEMGFTDQFNHIAGHYTVDKPIISCENCDYWEDFEEDYNEDFDEE
jgi:hypothetical protein